MVTTARINDHDQVCLSVIKKHAATGTRFGNVWGADRFIDPHLERIGIIACFCLFCMLFSCVTICNTIRNVIDFTISFLSSSPFTIRDLPHAMPGLWPFAAAGRARKGSDARRRPSILRCNKYMHCILRLVGGVE